MGKPGSESYAAIPPNSTGPQVRILQVTTLVEGVPLTVEMQVVAIADKDGNVFRTFTDAEWQDSVLSELCRIRRGIGKLVGDPFLEDELTT
jgi:hypothetical protein